VACERSEALTALLGRRRGSLLNHRWWHGVVSTHAHAAVETSTEEQRSPPFVDAGATGFQIYYHRDKLAEET
jgi:hypothetical protein